MKYATKIFSVLLIQMLLFGDGVQCAGDYSLRPAPDTLSPQVNIDYGQFQQVVSAYIAHQPSSQSRISDSGDPARPLSAAKKHGSGVKEFLKKKAGDVSLFILLRTDNHGLRHLACKALVKLKDTHNIYRLCFFGIEKEAILKNGTRNKRAQDALIKLYLISNAESEPNLLPLKRMLFKMFFEVENSARSRVVELLMLLPMSDKDREYIIPWLKTGNFPLFNKALTWIKKLRGENLDKLWGKKVLETLVAASSSQNMLKPVFLNMIDVMERLGAEEEQITEVCCNVLEKNYHTPVVYREAALRLGGVKSGKCKAMAVAVLIKRLNDASSIARFGAIEALGMLGEATAIPDLEARLVVCSQKKEGVEEGKKGKKGKRWQDIAAKAKKESVLLKETIKKLKEIKNQDALAGSTHFCCDSGPQVNRELTILAERSI
ncbi:MAG: HEAT repeat domain-containing protein [Candidatus Omnitrophica bacterium]|nr:HEAT repeat domain-containing protein [Candidatus Omnitrophota bacterium]